MGRVPIMNHETISKKATLALVSLAAKCEGKLSSAPSEESVAAIDDVLSMTTGMSFFGNATKSYTPNSIPCCRMRRARMFSLESRASPSTAILRLFFIKIPTPLLLSEEL